MLENIKNEDNYKNETFCVEIDKDFYIKNYKTLEELNIKNKKVITFFCKSVIMTGIVTLNFFNPGLGNICYLYGRQITLDKVKNTFSKKYRKQKKEFINTMSL